jgi:hypothetical protein
MDGVTPQVTITAIFAYPADYLQPALNALFNRQRPHSENVVFRGEKTAWLNSCDRWGGGDCGGPGLCELNAV